MVIKSALYDEVSRYIFIKKFIKKQIKMIKWLKELKFAFKCLLFLSTVILQILLMDNVKYCDATLE